jgi:hypothetical protein
MEDGRRGIKDVPKVSQSPTSVLQLPTRLTLFSGMLAIRGYQLPTSLVYSSTLSGLTSWNTIEWTYFPLANTCEKDLSISLSICWPSFVPYISEENGLRFEVESSVTACRASPIDSEPKLGSLEAVVAVAESLGLSEAGAEESEGLVAELALLTFGAVGEVTAAMRESREDEVDFLETTVAD